MKTGNKRWFHVILMLCMCLFMSMASKTEVKAATLSESEFAEKIAYLKTVYRDYEYWNYYNAVGVEGTGTKKCPSCSGPCSASCPDECGKFYLNGVKYGGQCYGFANKMGYLIFGSVPTASWTYSKSVTNYYAGDWVRVRSDAHSIFITKVSGDTITYVDCNNIGSCQVKWERTITKSSLKSITTYVYHYPGNTLTGSGVDSSTGSSGDSTGSSSSAINQSVNSQYSGYTPFKAYPISTGSIAVYNEYGTAYANRFITGSSDLCTINAVYTNGWCQVTYPSSVEASGYFTAYVQLSEFISSASPSAWTATASGTAYRRSTGTATIGSVSKGDSCLKVATANSRIQVIYPVSGQSYYKMGWVAESSSSSGSSSGTESTSYKLPCYSYARSTGNITVYNSSYTAYSNRYITGSTDLFIIRSVLTNGWCYVSYPSSAEADGYFEAYVPLDTFIPNANPVTWTAPASYTAYRRSSGSDTIGSVSAGDVCVAVSEENGRLQIMYPVSGQNYYKMGWVDASSSYNPQAAYDTASAGVYSVYVSGWAFDRDNLSAALEIHVYVGGRHVGTLTANGERTDVNNAYPGVGNYHGFAGTVSVPSDLAGIQNVEVYALNVGGGNNTYMGSKTVTITSDTTAPTISNVKVSNITTTGYTVTCTVTDANGVDRVQFPTWTTYNGQDDIFSDWTTNAAASGIVSGSTYTYHVYTSAHNFEGGSYATHIYAYDKYENQSSYTISDVIIVPIEVSELFLNTYSITLDTLGDTQTLTATVVPSNATDTTITWTSSNSSVATVSGGVVTAVGYGDAVITATASNGISVTCNVSVIEPALSSISVATNPSITTYYVGDYLITKGLTLNAVYENGTTETISSGFECTPEILNIVGTQTITVEYQGKQTTFQVKVKALPTGTMTVVGATGSPGEEVQVVICLDSNPGLIAARLQIAYDADALNLMAVEDGGLLGEYTFGNSLTSNPYVVMWENGLATSDYTSTGNLVYLTFKIADDADAGNYDITVSYDAEEIYNLDLVNVTYQINQGVVTVEENAITGTSGDLSWELNQNGVLTFSGNGVMKDYTYKSEMPWYSYISEIKTVVLEDGVTSIGAYAFYGMKNLTTVSVAESVTSIGDYAFKNSSALVSVNLPSELSSLGESAFYACTSLESIDIPASLYTIKPYTFKNCTSLASVTFHEGNLQKISDGAFYGTALTSVTLPDCLDILDVYVFKNCTGLAEVTLSKSLTQIREAALYGTAISTITIPEGVTVIKPYAFKNCTKLESIDLPSTLKNVEEAAFYACTKLGSVTLPDAVTSIGNYAFRKCTGLTEINFGSGLLTIGESSFYGCTGLSNLEISEKVTTIKGYAFKGCTGVTAVTLPESLTTIGESSFHTCTGLKTIVIPANVTKIGEYCFSGSYNLWKITFEGNAPAIGTSAFKGLDATVYYPNGNDTWTSDVMLNYGGAITWIKNV